MMDGCDVDKDIAVDIEDIKKMDLCSSPRIVDNIVTGEKEDISAYPAYMLYVYTDYGDRTTFKYGRVKIIDYNYIGKKEDCEYSALRFTESKPYTSTIHGREVWIATQNNWLRKSMVNVMLNYPKGRYNTKKIKKYRYGLFTDYEKAKAAFDHYKEMEIARLSRIINKLKQYEIVK